MRDWVLPVPLSLGASSSRSPDRLQRTVNEPATSTINKSLALLIDQIA
jgi:hypothetical protein